MEAVLAKSEIQLFEKIGEMRFQTKLVGYCFSISPSERNMTKRKVIAIIANANGVKRDLTMLLINRWDV
jgi:hypothetical protein